MPYITPLYDYFIIFGNFFTQHCGVGSREIAGWAPLRHLSVVTPLVRGLGSGDLAALCEPPLISTHILSPGHDTEA